MTFPERACGSFAEPWMAGANLEPSERFSRMGKCERPAREMSSHLCRAKTKHLADTNCRN